MRRVFMLAMAGLLMAGGVRAADAPDAAALTKILKEFLAGAQYDAKMHDRFWAEDLIYTSSAGKRIAKSDIMAEMKDAKPPQPGEASTVFSGEDIRIQEYGDTAVVAFVLVGKTTDGGKTTEQRYLNTGTFAKRNGEWKVVAWQATKAAEPEAAKAK
jgi:ketosteroid isomerase-like protein